MLQRLCAGFLVAASISAGTSAAAQFTPGGQMRIVLLVDSSWAVAPMITQIRAGLKVFLEELPGDPEIAFVTTGGQFRMRVAPTSDRQKLLDAAAAFASDGGANTFLSSLLEADRRVLKTAADRHSVFVIVTTDGAENVAEIRVDDYDRFMNDFVRRGGRAHAVVIHGVRSGPTTQMAELLVENSGGFHSTVAVASALPKVMKTLGDYVAADQ